jgi:hypothetical protein
MLGWCSYCCVPTEALSQQAHCLRNNSQLLHGRRLLISCVGLGRRESCPLASLAKLEARAHGGGGVTCPSKEVAHAPLQCWIVGFSVIGQI